MAEPKTKPTDVRVIDFLDTLPGEQRRKDGYALLEMMHKASGQEPVMWGPSIVGFGQYHYVYDSGHEGDACLIGFSPRKASLTLYLHGGFDRYADLLPKLGKYKTSKVCLYINKLSDIHVPTLQKMIVRSYNAARKAHKA